jgi:A/G-specific adenine glycosylase
VGAAEQGRSIGEQGGPLVDLAWRRRVGRRLLAWFRCHRRNLPWRTTRDPYAIWVSEVMLQQTQVATVVPYFQRFLRVFPTLTDLAAADEQAVLRLWEGLGYYRRARDLHRAARLLVAEHGGAIPNDPAALSGLPGFGPYTLGAVLSQAYDRPLPVVEANSQRVLSRLFGRGEDPRRGPGRNWLWKAAEALLPTRQVGDFNQALMELGALVCTPAAPHCSVCPLAQDCAARRLGLQDQIPPPAPLPQIIPVNEVAVVVHRGRKVLLAQRPREGRWAGLWEFPHGPVEQGESHEEAAARLLSGLAGLKAELGAEVLTLRHSITHHRITLVCLEACYRAGTFRSTFYQMGDWVEPRQLPAYPVSAPQRRLAQALVGPTRQRRLF